MNSKLNPMQEFENEFQKLLKETLFPNEKIIPNFSKFMDVALNTLSIAEMNCDKEIYLKLLQSRKQFLNDAEFVWSLMDISYIINAFSRVSPEKYGVELETYLGLINEFEKMAADWNAIVSEIRLNIAKKFEAKQKAIENNAPNMRVIPNKRNGKIRKR